MSETGDEYVRGWVAFRRTWLNYLAEPLGLLSPIGLHWLDEHWYEFEGMPGQWRAQPPHGIAFRFKADDDVRLDGISFEGEKSVPDLSAGTPLITQGESVLTPLLFPAQPGQPERVGIQVRSPAMAADRIEAGIPTYAPDARWVMAARFEPYSRPRPVTLHSIVNQMVKNLAIFGKVVFLRDGQEHTLEVYAGPRHELHIPFRDRTSGITTFAGSRLVFVSRPHSAGGGAFEFELDFNHAVNGPCGLTPYTTCALPPPGNTLPFAVEAGEKIPQWMTQPGDWAR